MAKEVTLRCKICGEPLGYSEEAYCLMAEKGESKFLRCQECRQSHGREIKEVKIPYFSLRKRVIPGGNLVLFGHTFHGERVLREEEKIGEDWNFTITDDEILTLYQLLQRNQVVIVASPTGTGKSIYIPKRLIEPPEDYAGDFVKRLIHQGQIIITQPRILATEDVPRKQAQVLGSSLGPTHLVSYRHSGKDLSGRWNLLLTITDGTLPNWLREGKLGQYSLIMVDEAHERSCNIDGILGFLRRELPKYPQLRLIISSATINAQKFVDAFKEMNVQTKLFDLSFLARKKKQKGFIHFWKNENAYVLSPEGELEETTDCECWLCQKLPKEKREFWKSQKDEISESDLPEITAALVSQILAETKKGDIVVFLHGEGAIKQTVQKVESRHKEVKVIPIYRKIQEEAERELAKETTKRRVIVGTNLLETSVTLKGVVYGIDSGFIKEAKWDPATQISTLPTERHSQDGRKQRWGRLGRTEDGYIYNLYAKEEFEKAEEHTLPEITRSCLEDSLVSLKGAGVTTIDQFPWMERPSDHLQMEKEIKRARQSLKEREVIDQKEEITERALELLGIPRQAGESSFLVLADDQGCLFEAITTLFLMSTREQEARTGANLYSSGLGLLLWEPEWDAKTKAQVWALHQGLRAGCRDDLDFVIKLAYCFRGAESRGISQEWAKRHFVNYDNLQKILSDIDNLITESFGEEREESVREIDITQLDKQLDKIRALMATAWPEKVVNLKPGEPITYLVVEEERVGVVSRLCAGSWQGKKQAISAAAIEREVVLEGYPQKVPTASFMVQLPGQVPPGSYKNLFVDQRFPVGSWVQVEKKDRKFYLGELEKLPLPIKVRYRKTLDLSEDYLEEELGREEEIPFDRSFLIEEEFAVPLEGIWISEKTAEKARIVEWRERDGIPVAILSPFEESDIRSLGKKIGDTLEVKIHQITRDPIGRRGWIIARTREGFDIPVELSEMSLSPWGPGLKRIKGQTLNLTVKEVDEDGLPQLSNIDKVIEDLSAMRKEISEKNIFPSSVVEINEEEETATAVTERADGVIHPFEIYKDFVPGEELSNLKMDEEVIINLSMPSTERDHAQADCLTREEIENIHMLPGGEYDRDKNEISFSYCLEDNGLNNWPARTEAIDFVKRHSWQYCLVAKIEALKERLSQLKEMDMVEGIIKQIDYEEDGKTIKSVQVVVKGNIPGFAFGRDLGSLPVSERDKILFYIKAVNPHSGSLRLVSKQSEDEKRKKREEFIERTEANIRRWKNNIRKARATIEKIRQNIAENQDKLRTTRSKEWEARFQLWIEEDERKIRDIEPSIQDWLLKIDSARSKLR